MWGAAQGCGEAHLLLRLRLIAGAMVVWVIDRLVGFPGGWEIGLLGLGASTMICTHWSDSENLEKKRLTAAGEGRKEGLEISQSRLTMGKGGVEGSWFRGGRE